MKLNLLPKKTIDLSYREFIYDCFCKIKEKFSNLSKEEKFSVVEKVITSCAVIATIIISAKIIFNFDVIVYSNIYDLIGCITILNWIIRRILLKISLIHLVYTILVIIIISCVSLIISIYRTGVQNAKNY